LLYFLEIGIDHVFAVARFLLVVSGRAVGLCTAAGSTAVTGLTTLLRAALAVHRLSELVGCVGQLLGRAIHFVGILGFKLALRIGQRLFDALARCLIELRTIVLQRLLGGVDEIVELIARFRFQPPLVIACGVLLSIAYHLLDVFLGKSRRS